MKKISFFLLLALIVFLFSSCSPEITKGKVIEKEYRPSSSRLIMMPISTGKTIVSVPYYIRHPERYVVVITAIVEGESVTEDFYVSKEVYDSLSIGDIFEYDDSRGDLCEEPSTKERANETE